MQVLQACGHCKVMHICFVFSRACMCLEGRKKVVSWCHVDFYSLLWESDDCGSDSSLIPPCQVEEGFPYAGPWAGICAAPFCIPNPCTPKGGLETPTGAPFWDPRHELFFLLKQHFFLFCPSLLLCQSCSSSPFAGILTCWLIFRKAHKRSVQGLVSSEHQKQVFRAPEKQG